MKPLQTYIFETHPDIPANDVVQIIKQKLESPWVVVCGNDCVDADPSRLIIVASFGDQLTPRRAAKDPGFFAKLLGELCTPRTQRLHLEEFRAMANPPQFARLDLTYPAPAG